MRAPAADRYEKMPYARCGRSGLRLPRISLGLWQNFGGTSPLAQGLLTTKYLSGIPDSSRAAQNDSLRKSMLTAANLGNVRALDEIARQRGQSLAQMAIAWVLAKPAITSALIGASAWAQVEECLGALRNLEFSPLELDSIDRHARDGGLNIWAASSQSG